jgi:hypothetical protein
MESGAEVTVTDTSRYCRTQLTSEDYVATFIAASGELPGILLMVAIIDRIGRRATMGWGAIICASVCLLLIPCTSYNVETALIWVGRGVGSAFFQSMFVYTSELYPVCPKCFAELFDPISLPVVDTNRSWGRVPEHDSNYGYGGRRGVCETRAASHPAVCAVLDP